MSVAIKIENVSKLYRLGTVGTGTISHDLNRWWHTIRGKEDPYAKVGQVNDRTKGESSDEKRDASEGTGDSSQLATRNSQLSSPLATRSSSLRSSAPDYVWALKDVNLEVEQGEIFGIIGANGAGKSTLLKLLSRVTAPTNGSIRSRGRIASLLEVGTGFHPELTGRENIYLNGSILGMKRSEITSEMDAIVEFSGCAKYLDTPVKRYSSGMTVRLGFAIAAHLKCEILIVDEVLAVGDMEFQQSCIGKMQDISKNSGRTVLFVSHQLPSVANLCQRVAVMERGSINFVADATTAIRNYLDSHYRNDGVTVRHINHPYGRFSVSISSLQFSIGDPIVVNFEFESEVEIRTPRLSITISNRDGTPIAQAGTAAQLKGFRVRKGKQALQCRICEPVFSAGQFFVDVFVLGNGEKLAVLKQAFNIEMKPADLFNTGNVPNSRSAPVIIRAEWDGSV
jgi:lipopolysaccharide transport system ATP-binding protein